MIEYYQNIAPLKRYAGAQPQHVGFVADWHHPHYFHLPRTFASPRNLMHTRIESTSHKSSHSMVPHGSPRPISIHSAIVQITVVQQLPMIHFVLLLVALLIAPPVFVR